MEPLFEPAYTGLIPDMRESVYHADRSLSSTGARKLLKAPAKYRHAIDNPEGPKREFDVGAAAHSKVLGRGAEVVTVPKDLLASNGARSTKAAKEWMDDARLRGQVVVTDAEFEQVNAMAESILAHPTGRVLLEQEGLPEASVFAVDPETGVPVRCRFDFLGQGPGRRVAVDLKTDHGEATPGEFARTVYKHGYHIQQPWYEDVAATAGVLFDTFAFVVVEKDPPHLTAVFVLDSDYITIGRAQAARARRLFAHALQTNLWAGYPAEIQLVRPPQFAIYDHIDKENSHGR